MPKLKLGIYWAGGCGGCDMAVLELHERLLTVLEAVDVVFWPCVLDTRYHDVESMEDGSMDACLINGAICTTENASMATLLRRKAKVLIAFGACAASGGIPGLANVAGRVATMREVYEHGCSTLNPEHVVPQPRTLLAGGTVLELPECLEQATGLDKVVAVDAFVPGCPPTAARTAEVLEALAAGTLALGGAVVGAGTRSVCDECGLRKELVAIPPLRRLLRVIPEPGRCLLEQGLLCLGPVTRSGCGGECMRGAMPCRGCYGPARDGAEAGLAMMALLGGMLERKQGEEGAVPHLEDPIGSLYRYAFAHSSLARLASRSAGAR